ncbi:hypothetical protein LX16_0392 [Stackebrandtia albiflava]|uniref:Uncharacterized protein n=1 Tax=Stackebrandtia albiflava TaxID=406432 RepID=A0A562VA26_9ACTN|nr:hypothetical protein [Stackebrandtia albiflava]TWJ14703.1 hypothetical protein LX16_0392 [Stackebrandtia albiflava]
MKPEEVKSVFHDALDQVTPVARSTTDDIVVHGRRKVRWRRTLTAGVTAAVVGIGVVGVAVAMPTAPPPAPAGEAASENATTGECAPVSGVAPGEPDPVAKMYQDALVAEAAEYSFLLPEYFLGDPRHDMPAEGFVYDPAACGYVLDTVAGFEGGHQTDMLAAFVAVYDPAEGDVADRMAGIAGCGEIDGECEWAQDAPEDRPRLLVDEVRRIQVDEDEGEPQPIDFRATLTALEDGTILHIEVSPQFGEGFEIGLDHTQLTAMLAAIPVGEEAPELPGIPGSENPDDETRLIELFLSATVAEIPGAELSDTDITFEDTGEDGIRVASTTLTVDGGEVVEIDLWSAPIDAPGDGGATEEPARHYAFCDAVPGTECVFTAIDDMTAGIHKTVPGDATELSAWRFRVDTAYNYGVIVRYADASGTPPIDFAQLDAIVDQLK